MLKLNKKSYRDLRDRDSQKEHGPAEIVKCNFLSCAIYHTRPELRSVFKDIIAQDCKLKSCVVHGGVFDNCTFQRFAIEGLLQIWCSVFKNVTIADSFGKVMISPLMLPGKFSQDIQKLFDESSEEFYAHTDLALDISNAEFLDADISGVPPHLIRRDPETQVVVEAEAVDFDALGKLNLSWGGWELQLSRMLNRQEKSAVLIAPKKSKRCRNMVRDLRILQQHGIASPD